MATHQKKHVKNKGNQELILKEAGEEYATVESPLGGSPPRFICRTLTNKEINASLKGSIRQRVYKGDVVLVQKDETTTEKEKFIIIHKYKDDHKKTLSKLGELKSINIEGGGGGGAIQFEGEGGVEDEKEIAIDDL